MPAAAVKPDKQAERRLLTHAVIWLVTVGPNHRPHAVPVWFWWDGSSFLIYSLPGQKVRDIAGNAYVQLHLNTDRSGDKVLRVEGRAQILKDATPAYRMSKYIAKYREQIKSYGWTPKAFSDQYHVALRVKPSSFRS